MTAKRGGVAVFVPHAGCPHRCSFCDQTAISGARGMPTPGEVAALCRDALARNDGGRRLELAFFGGSFTAVDEADMLGLLEAVQPFLGPGGFAGIRVSTRPDAVDGAAPALLRRYGVTAVELGAQSMDDAVLRQNGRGHTAGQVRRAAGLIQEAGLELVLQMMAGLPGEGSDGPLDTARALIALSPDAARIYPALILRGAGLERLWRAGDYRPLGLEEAVDVTARVMELFEEADIPLIRVGLHPSAELEQTLLAGPFHPAFRELCEGRLMLGRLLPQLAGRPPGDLFVAVRPEEISRMVGHRRQNALELARRGHRLRVVPDAGNPARRPRLLD